MVMGEMVLVVEEWVQQFNSSLLITVSLLGTCVQSRQGISISIVSPRAVFYSVIKIGKRSDPTLLYSPQFCCL